TPPPPGKLLVYGNGPQGGVNWQPISYNENTHMFYVCSAVSHVGIQAGPVPFTSHQKTWAGALGIARIAGTEAGGRLAAIDATSGRVAWQKQFPDACYSGTTTTKSGLVFVGRNAGELQAYDASNGKLLWSFQTGAGANNQPTIFQQDGKEYLAFFS